MEHKTRGLQKISNLLSKTVGLVFFSFLAISLGVVFGLLFDGWVKDPKWTPVDADNGGITGVSENQVVGNELLDLEETAGEVKDEISTGQITENQVKPATIVKYKVRVGPYDNRQQALAASDQLHALGYPVYVGKDEPYAVQVGAFSTQTNADRLKSELQTKGFKAFVESSQ